MGVLQDKLIIAFTGKQVIQTIFTTYDLVVSVLIWCQRALIGAWVKMFSNWEIGKRVLNYSRPDSREATRFRREKAVNFEEVKMRWSWTPIRNCPGRFLLSQRDIKATPEKLVGMDIQFREFQVATTRDTVVVGQISDGGLISYRRKNGTYVHTLNTKAGFDRKLEQLGIAF